MWTEIVFVLCLLHVLLCYICVEYVCFWYPVGVYVGHYVGNINMLNILIYAFKQTIVPLKLSYQCNPYINAIESRSYAFYRWDCAQFGGSYEFKFGLIQNELLVK